MLITIIKQWCKNPGMQINHKKCLCYRRTFQKIIINRNIELEHMLSRKEWNSCPTSFKKKYTFKEILI